MIHETKDYNMFKMVKGNRELNEAHIKVLMEEISKLNLLHIQPILVTKDMEVIDGQHRLEAAKRLGVPICYRVVEGDAKDLMTALNIHKPWGLKNFMNVFAEKGLLPYKRILEVSEKFSITPAVISRIFPPKKCGEKDYISKYYRNGEYDYYITDEDIERLAKVKDCLSAFKDFFSWPKAAMNRHYILLAIFAFLKRKDVTLDGFIRRIAMYPPNTDVPFTTLGMKKLLVNIYNWKNKSERIELEE